MQNVHAWCGMYGCTQSWMSGKVPTILRKKQQNKTNQKKKGREGGNNIKVTENTPSEKLQKHMKL